MDSLFQKRTTEIPRSLPFHLETHGIFCAFNTFDFKARCWTGQSVVTTDALLYCLLLRRVLSVRTIHSLGFQCATLESPVLGDGVWRDVVRGMEERCWKERGLYF